MATTLRAALGSTLAVALLLGALLGAIFLQLLAYSRAMRDLREFYVWIGEWVFFDVALTALICRKEIAVLLAAARTQDAAEGKPPAPGPGTSTPLNILI